MAERSTLARPYARAAFEVAQEAEALPRWSEMLAALEIVVEDEDVQPVLSDPLVDPERVADMVIGVLDERLDEGGRNFVRLLSVRRRLRLLPEIREQYEAYRADAENVIDVEIRAAVEMDEKLRARFEKALKARLGRDVRLHCEVDEDLLGGAVIRAGDLVIDGTVRNRLEDLAGTIRR